MTELARPGWHGTAALARSAAGFLCGPFRCVTPGCAVADIQVSQRDWKSATAAVRRSRAEAHGVAAWSSLSPEGSGQRGHDRDLGSCSFGNRCLPASAASARPLPCGEAGSHRDGRPGDREPLLSSDARHFGAAWDCEQLCSPVLISGPAPLLWAPGGHGGGNGRLLGAPCRLTRAVTQALALSRPARAAARLARSASASPAGRPATSCPPLGQITSRRWAFAMTSSSSASR